MKALLGIFVAVGVLTLVAWIGLPLLMRRSQADRLYEVSIVIPEGFIGSLRVVATEPPSKERNLVLRANGSTLAAPSDLLTRGYTLHEVWTEGKRPVPLQPTRVGEYGYLGPENTVKGFAFRFGAVTPASYKP